MVRSLDPTDHNPKRTRKVEKLYGDELDFKDMKFPVKVREIFTKLKEKVSLALLFLVMNIRKNIQK